MHTNYAPFSRSRNADNYLRVGTVASIASATLAIIYDAGQLAEWLGWLGSGGGPENASTWVGLVVLLTPSFLLGYVFLISVISVQHYASAENRFWAHCATEFASIYTTMITINYFTQLTFVAPHMLSGDISNVSEFVFTPFDSFLYSVDILGYSFMCLAMLFISFVFNAPEEKMVRSFMFVNGLLVPFLLLQNFYHFLIYPASLWAFTFPAAMIGLARLQRRRIKMYRA